MLRKDFINNFLHEFKPPIVSYGGFARLILEGDLSEDIRTESPRTRPALVLGVEL